MEEKLILLKALNLVAAVNNNNINETKELVTWLNNNFQSNDEIPDLDTIVSLDQLAKPLPNELNESYEYVVFNLNNINSARFKSHLTTRNLVKEKDFNKIEQFVNNYLEEENIENFKIADLIQLCISVDRYDLLDKVRKTLSSYFEEK